MSMYILIFTYFVLKKAKFWILQFNLLYLSDNGNFSGSTSNARTGTELQIPGLVTHDKLHTAKSYEYTLLNCKSLEEIRSYIHMHY